MSSSRNYYAQPVVRDNFSYHGNSFYVTVDGNRHERADAPYLYRLLTYTEPTAPVLTKAGYVAKRQPPPHKDPPGHFYCAQLIHYGLKPLKTKEPAKKKLLEAFGGKPNNPTLPVPKENVKLEETLRKQYLRANEIAKKISEEDKRLKEIQQEERRKKRKRDDDVIMQDVIDLEEFLALDGSGAENEISHAQLRDTIATLPADSLRKILTKLVDDIPAAERAAKEEIRKLPSSADDAKTSRAVTKGKGKETQTQTQKVYPYKVTFSEHFLTLIAHSLVN